MSHPKSPISAFRGERIAGIGHNQGPPLDGGQSWRGFVWKKARRELLPRLPLEVIRRRIARARELGLEYPQYASILLGTGRDIVAFLFTSEGLQLRLERVLDIPEPVAAKVAGLQRCERLVVTRADPRRLAVALSAEVRLGVRAVSPLPDEATPGQGRAAIRAALAPLKLPGDAVVMVGTRDEERKWADAAHLARFLPAENYFPGA